jgi:putative inorganic carbon (hco3(-)) transporter
MRNLDNIEQFEGKSKARIILFHELRIVEILNFTFKQMGAFWILLLYIIFEYLRPQGMYTEIDVIPWGASILILGIIVTFFEGRLLSIKTNGDLLITSFFLVIILSSSFAISPEISFGKFKQVIVLLMIFYFMTAVVDTEERLYIFLLLFLIVNLKLSQFVFRNWFFRGFEYEKYGASAGIAWLENSGELAIQMCMTFAISFYFGVTIWKNVGWIKKIIIALTPVTFLGSVLACGSRGSFLAISVVLILIWFGSKKKVLSLSLVLAVFLISIIIMAHRDQRDFDRIINMGGKDDKTAINRLERWEKGIKLANMYPLLGVGYGNWAIADKNIFGGEGELVHNIYIECMSELGYLGLSVFILLIVYTVKINFETMRISINKNRLFLYNTAKSLNLALVAYLVAGLFVTVLYYPYFWINLAMTVCTNNVAKIKTSANDENGKE